MLIGVQLGAWLADNPQERAGTQDKALEGLHKVHVCRQQLSVEFPYGTAVERDIHLDHSGLGPSWLALLQCKTELESEILIDRQICKRVSSVIN